MQSLAINNLTLDSREVASMIEKRHCDLIRDVETYRDYLNESQNAKLRSDDFFINSEYKSGTGKRYKCYLITKKGCELIAHKMTGKKGVQFTAEYIERFHDMEQKLGKPISEFKEPKEYTPKYYRGEPVVTVHDIEAKSNVADYTIRYHLRKLIRNVDYYLLEGAELAEFKRQNPSVDKMYSSLLVINRKGFGKLVKLMRSFSTLGSFKHALPAPEPKEEKVKYVNLLDNNEMHARIVDMNRKAHTVLELLEQLMRKNDEDSHLSICKTLEVLTRRMSVDCDFSYIKYDLIER